LIYEFYFSIFFIFIAAIISALLVAVSDLLIEEIYDANKASVYECGFQPIDLNLQQFEVRFYVVGLLFLVFDVEIAFFLPLISSGHAFTCYIMFISIVFINCFFITFLYEWKNNFLNWS